MPDAETKTAAEQCLRFLARCAEGRLAATMDESNDAYALTLTVQECITRSLDQVRIYVLTDQGREGEEFQAAGSEREDREARGHGHRAAASALVGGQAAR